MKKYKLYIFDIDGVIFDSKLNMMSSWNEVRIKHNIKSKFEDYFKLIGTPFLNILKKLKINTDIKKIAKTYNQNSLKYINKVKLYPNVKVVLNKLKKKKQDCNCYIKGKKKNFLFFKKI